MSRPIPEDLPSEFHGLWTAPMQMWSPTEGRLTLERIATLEAELREAKQEYEAASDQLIMAHEDMNSLRVENAILLKTVARLIAPVSDEEWDDFSHYAGYRDSLASKSEVSALIAERMTAQSELEALIAARLKGQGQ